MHPTPLDRLPAEDKQHRLVTYPAGLAGPWSSQGRRGSAGEKEEYTGKEDIKIDRRFIAGFGLVRASRLGSQEGILDLWI